jgi:hypothetical protein
MISKLHCAACGRYDEEGSSGVKTITYQRHKWCTSCADIAQTENGTAYVLMTSPGQMVEGSENDQLAAWNDCYSKKIKKRILVKKAKTEIQRAWEIWEGDKTSDHSMFFFFGWLSKFRPYFLTFRSKDDSWQRVHSWLIQYEGQKRKNG